ncbi:ABC transporter [Vagococcus humatus]|uniref:ABC transporter n=1 Tax=Vagococcus humatus TaxID=1889241 RepID=A0A3R9YKH7_9ENTE|nr:ABC transporter [Vagococcus humatus]RST89821.1 ABC transporter [Vagococcus humatus]
MNKQHITALTAVNLRYANPQVTDKLRKKGKKGKKLTQSLANQFLFSGLIFLGIYGVTMVLMDFSKMPGFFTYYVALFSLLAFSQGISVIYNVFFESQDLQAYLSLPFRQTEIFLAKSLVVAITILPFVFPMLVVFLLTGFRSGVFLPVTIVISLLLFILILAIVFSLSSLVVFGLTRTKFFHEHKKVVTSLLLVISMVLTVLGIIFMSNQNTQSGLNQLDRVPIHFLLPIYRIASAPLSKTGLVALVSLLAFFLALLLVIKGLILPHLYDQLTSASMAKGESRRLHKTGQNLSQLLRMYNLQLVKDPNLLMQVIASSFLMPVVFIVSFALGGSVKLNHIDPHLIGVVFGVGLALATMTTNATSFISLLISLDQENFNFIQSLPISMSNYLRTKFRLGFAMQLLLSGSLALVGGLVFRLPVIFIVALLLGNSWGTYLLSHRYFARDYRLLLLEWTNVAQLFTRGAGNKGLVFNMFGSLLGSTIVLVLYGIGSMSTYYKLVNLVAVFVLLIGSGLWLRYYQKKFWQTFQ